jgi:hypothetical protein
MCNYIQLKNPTFHMVFDNKYTFERENHAENRILSFMSQKNQNESRFILILIVSLTTVW